MWRLFLFGFLSACCTTTLWLFLGLDFHSGEFRIDEDTSAVFADDDLLVHLDVELALWRNLVKATTTGVTLHVDDSQTVVGTFTYAQERLEQARFYALLDGLCASP